MTSSKRYKKAKKQRPVNKLDLVVFILNILAITLLLLTYLAPGTDPRSFTFIALLGFIYPLLVIFNLAFCVFWVIRKKAWACAIIIACIVLGFDNLFATFGFRNSPPPPVKKLPNALRMMSYNVNEFQTADRSAGNTDSIFKLVPQVNPDVLNVIELRSLFNQQLDSLKNIMGAKYCFFKAFDDIRSVHYKIAADGSRVKFTLIRHKGCAILSKYPIIDTGIVQGPKLLDLQAIYADIKKGNDTIRIYCLHLAAVKIETKQKRGFLTGNISANNTSFIKSKLSAAFIKRSYQVDKIKNNIDSCKYQHIITGDFNDTPVSYAVNTIGAGLKNSFNEKGSSYCTTYYSTFPLQIDYIFVSPQIDVLSYQAIDKKYSDHKPIVVDLLLK